MRLDPLRVLARFSSLTALASLPAAADVERLLAAQSASDAQN